MPRPWPGLSLAKNRNNDNIIKLINMLGEWLKTTYTCKKCLHNYLVTNNVNKNGYVFLQFRVLTTKQLPIGCFLCNFYFQFAPNHPTEEQIFNRVVWSLTCSTNIHGIKMLNLTFLKLVTLQSKWKSKGHPWKLWLPFFIIRPTKYGTFYSISLNTIMKLTTLVIKTSISLCLIFEAFKTVHN